MNWLAALSALARRYCPEFFALSILAERSPIRVQAVSGITWLAPILPRLHELDQYEDAALMKAKVAAVSSPTKRFRPRGLPCAARQGFPASRSVPARNICSCRRRRHPRSRRERAASVRPARFFRRWRLRPEHRLQSALQIRRSLRRARGRARPVQDRGASSRAMGERRSSFALAPKPPASPCAGAFAAPVHAAWRGGGGRRAGWRWHDGLLVVYLRARLRRKAGVRMGAAAGMRAV